MVYHAPRGVVNPLLRTERPVVDTCCPRAGPSPVHCPVLSGRSNSLPWPLRSHPRFRVVAGQTANNDIGDLVRGRRAIFRIPDG